MSDQVLLLGIGNVLWADEGFGVRAIEAFNECYEVPDSVRLMDGGTQGIYLVPHVQEADILVVFDAIDYGLDPGMLKVIRDQAVPSFMGAKKMSLHQTGFQEVLAMAEMLGRCPQKLLLIGVQPEELEDYGGSLRPSVKAQIQPALEIAVAYLQEQGIQVCRRSGQATAETLAHHSIALNDYESRRPSEEDACRLGDPRVLQSGQVVFDPKAVTAEPLSYSVDLDKRRQD